MGKEDTSKTKKMELNLDKEHFAANIKLKIKVPISFSVHPTLEGKMFYTLHEVYWNLIDLAKHP